MSIAMVKKGIIATALSLLILSTAYGQECLYNETICACSFGSTEGTCYVRTGATVNGVDLCAKRACDPGWTCDCRGDYYCEQADISVYTLIDFNDFDQTTALCQLTAQRTITSSGFELGFFHPQFSDSGLLAQECQLFAWWLNGELQNNFNSPTTVDRSNLDSVKASMSDWNNLPLKSGSVIAFRWRDAPYSCYNSISEMNINGTALDTGDSSAVTHRFSNIFEDDWFAPDFVEGSDWKGPIASNTGDNYDVENMELTNTYWRIKIHETGYGLRNSYESVNN